MLTARHSRRLLCQRVSAQRVAFSRRGVAAPHPLQHFLPALRTELFSSYSRNKSAKSSITSRQQWEKEGLAVRPSQETLPRTIEDYSESAYVTRRTRPPSKPKTKAQLQNETRQAQEAQKMMKEAEVKTQGLLEIPPGEFSDHDWRTARDLIEYWCTSGIYSRRPSQTPIKLPVAAVEQSVDRAFALLEKMVQEQLLQNSTSLSKAILNESLLEIVLRNWKQVCRRASSSRTMQSHLTPFQMLSNLEKLTNQSTSLTFTTRIYNVIMDVAIQQGIRASKSPKNARDEDGYSAVQATPQMIETAQFVESLVERVQCSTNLLEADSVTLTHAVNAWSLVGDGARAQYWLQEMCDAHQQKPNDDQIKPSRNAFHSVLNAYARGPKTDETMDQCYTIVHRMQAMADQLDLDVAPNVHTYNIVLACLANNPLVEDALSQAELLFQDGMSDIRDVRSYNTLLDMYAKRGMATKAEALLERMYEEYRATQERLLQPNVKSFNIVLSAWSRAGNAGAVERLFGLMEELHASQTLRGIAPDAFTYSIVLESWAQQVGKIPDAADRMEAILNTMKRLARAGNGSLEPTTVTYSILLKAFAKAGYAARAEELLGEMMDQCLQQNNKHVKPDLTAFNTVLLALSRSDRPDAVIKIRALMAQMEELATGGVLGNTLPDIRSWNSLLQAIARTGRRSAGHECEKILKALEKDPKFQPNTVSYATAIQAYAKAGQAEDAERILQSVCDEYYKYTTIGDNVRLPPTKPSVQLFTSVMKAWAKRRTAESPEKAEALMERMKDLSLAGDLDGHIDTVCYNAMLDTWTNSGRRDAGERTETILEEMRHNPLARPDTVSYNTALNVFAASGEADRCQKLFEKMQEDSRSTGKNSIRPGFDTLCTVLKAWSNAPIIADNEKRAQIVLRKLRELQDMTGIRANAACYNVVLDCLAKSGKLGACELAEDLLHEMEKLAAEENGSFGREATVAPDLISYGTVINAYGNMGQAEKAEMILERMIDDYVRSAAKHRVHRPNLRCFNNVLAAWSQRAKQGACPEAVLRANSILERMQRLHKISGIPVKPNIVSYNIVLGCLANSGLADSGIRAEAMLKEMIKSGDRDIAPETRSFNAVIAAFAKTGNIKRALDLAEDMHNTYTKKEMIGEPFAVRPDIITWNTVLSACSKWRDPGAVDKAESILQRMEHLHESGALEVGPNVVSFNNLLNCIARAKRNDAGERCESILANMEARAAAGEKDVKPNAISYGAAIRAWAIRHNFERAKSLLFTMCRAYEAGDQGMKPTVETFRSVLKCISSVHGREAGVTAEIVRNQMKQLYPNMLDANSTVHNSSIKAEAGL